MLVHAQARLHAAGMGVRCLHAQALACCRPGGPAKKGGAHSKAGGGEAQVEDEVQDLVVQGAIQAHQADACAAAHAHIQR
jgi:hypothetical protein